MLEESLHFNTAVKPTAKNQIKSLKNCEEAVLGSQISKSSNTVVRLPVLIKR